MAHCTLNVKELAQKGGETAFRLDNDFFSAFDNEDVVGGTVDVALKVEKSQDHKCDYHVDYEVSGTLKVTCTRCLEEMSLEVLAADSVKVVCGGGEPEGDDEDLLQAQADGTLDLSHRVFETLALSVPMVRVHPDGECNPQVMKWLEEHSGTAE